MRVAIPRDRRTSVFCLGRESREASVCTHVQVGRSYVHIHCCFAPAGHFSFIIIDIRITQDLLLLCYPSPPPAPSSPEHALVLPAHQASVFPAVSWLHPMLDDGLMCAQRPRACPRGLKHLVAFCGIQIESTPKIGSACKARDLVQTSKFKPSKVPLSMVMLIADRTPLNLPLY